MSLPKSPSGDGPQNLASSPFPTARTGRLSALQDVEEVDEVDILKLYAPPTPPEHSAGKTTINLGPDLPLLPHIPSKSLYDFAFSGTPLNISQRPARPHSPLVSATDSSIDSITFTHFEGPQALSELDFSLQEHFGTSVRDFMGSNFPGCEIPTLEVGAEPLSAVNSIAGKGKKSLDVKDPCLEQLPSYSQLPRLRTGAPAYELTDRENQADNLVCESSAATATGPETPMFSPWADGSDFSFDGMSASMKRRNTTGDRTEQNTADNNEASPTSNVPPRSLSVSPFGGRRSRENTPDSQGSDASAKRTIDYGNNDLDNSVSAIKTVPNPAPREASLDAGRPIDIVLPSHPLIPGVPRDITDELSSPRPRSPRHPKAKRRKRKSIRRSIQKFYRKARSVFLSREVLDFIIGRQLSKPTRDNLVAISKGLPAIIVDVETTESDSPRSTPS